MRIIHGKGYSTEELAAFRRLVHSNVVTAMQLLLEATELLNMRLPKDMKVQMDRRTCTRMIVHTCSERARLLVHRLTGEQMEGIEVFPYCAV